MLGRSHRNLNVIKRNGKGNLLGYFLNLKKFRLEFFILTKSWKLSSLWSDFYIFLFNSNLRSFLSHNFMDGCVDDDSNWRFNRACSGREPTGSSSICLHIMSFEINLPPRHHHWTLHAPEVYYYHKSACAHWSIVSVHDFPKWDLIASIQLGHLVLSLIRVSFEAGEFQMSSAPSLRNCPKCNRHSKLSDHRNGSCLGWKCEKFLCQ